MIDESRLVAVARLLTDKLQVVALEADRLRADAATTTATAERLREGVVLAVEAAARLRAFLRSADPDFKAIDRAITEEDQ